MPRLIVGYRPIKTRINPSSAASETYNINMNTFDDGQPEEFLSLLRNYNIATNGTGTTTPSSWINYLRTMLCGQALREFDKIQSQYGGATNNYLNIIQEVLLEYFFTISVLSKQKRSMRGAMHKPRSMTFKRFVARLTEINNFQILFPVPNSSKKIEMEELNKILLMQCPIDGPRNPTYKVGILS